MSDTTQSTDSGVLRPFVPPQSDPLPPVEPSAVVVPPPPAPLEDDQQPRKTQGNGWENEVKRNRHRELQTR